MSYGTTTRLDAPYAEAVERVRAALQKQGFGVLTEIDVAATLKAKLDRDLEPYVILGACNPHLAAQALDGERSIGLLLPCNVVVRADGDGSLVEVLDPHVMVQLTDSPEVARVADEAARLLGNVVEELSA